MYENLLPKISAFYVSQENSNPAAYMKLKEDTNIGKFPVSLLLLNVNKKNMDQLHGLIQVFDSTSILWSDNISLNVDTDVIPDTNYLNENIFSVNLNFKTPDINLPENKMLYVRFDLFSDDRLLDTHMTSLFTTSA